ncbi:MAG: Acyl-CoA synthetase [Blastococcus sp.]|nr:Acyl-CoA synthetase [Blastococcus sp.]
MNFAEVLDIADARSPEAEAVRLDARRLSYRELRTQARRVAGLLEDVGLPRDGKAAVLLYNALEYAEIGFGIMGGGGVLLPINPRLAPAEIRYVVDNADVEVVFLGVEFVDAFAQIREQLPRVTTVFLVGDDVDAGQFPQLGAWRSYRDALAEATPVDSWARTAPDDDCMLVYTSGTTGNPKGAVRSHSSALWGAANFSSVWGQFSPEGDRFLYAIPLASIGFLNVFASCLFNGLTVELMYKFQPEAALELIESHGVTHAYLVPAMWRMIIRSPQLDDFDTSALRVGIWGGEPLDDNLRDAIIARFGNVLLGVFGTTEGALLSSRPGDDERHPKTSGRAAGFNIFRIVDEEGNEVPRGQVGELINKSPTVLSRYYKNDAASADVLRDGWYFTGDLARMNDEGFVFVVDRKREMLITGGQNVYPAELERVLCDHPAVAAAAVIGIPDEDWGEVPMAFVVPAGPGEPSTDELARHMRENLAGYKVARRWQLVDELPTNSMGKVRKHSLRESLRQPAD